MFGVAEIQELRTAVARFAGGFDPALVSPADAQSIVEEAAAAEHMLATVRALAAKRLADSEVWRRQGERSAAHHLARACGTSVGKARAALQTAGQLGRLPGLEAAARQGEVSPDQAAPIADAAGADPASEQRLLHAARRSSLAELRDACARTKAAALPDDASRHEAIRRSRYLRKRRCADGAGELTYRSTADEVAEIFAIAPGYADRRFAEARADGRREPAEAYLADGLLDAVRAGVSPTPAPVPPRTADAVPDERPGEPGAPSAPVAAGRPCTDDEGSGGPMEELANALAERLEAAAKRPKRPPSPHKVIVRVDWWARRCARSPVSGRCRWRW
ncbi:MAG TPA: DUF222 domain-containing protein [Acidimicrobiales bacterium]|nr:DUF222 domain-containing protein [Acidimicrobiales bacterium]